MRAELCVGMCIHVCMDMCTDMCTNMCSFLLNDVSAYGHVCEHVWTCACRHVCGDTCIHVCRPVRTVTCAVWGRVVYVAIVAEVSSFATMCQARHADIDMTATKDSMVYGTCLNKTGCINVYAHVYTYVYTHMP